MKLKNKYLSKDDITKIFVKSRRHGNFEVLIDAEDLEKVKKCKSISVWLNPSTETFYARINFKIKGEWRSFYLHRYVLDVSNPNLQVDHIFHNTLDNRKSKLRVVTHAENNQNRFSYSRNTSGYIGVSWNKKRKKWVAQIMINGKGKFLGYHDNKEDAIQARLAGEEKFFGYKSTLPKKANDLYEG